MLNNYSKYIFCSVNFSVLKIFLKDNINDMTMNLQLCITIIIMVWKNFINIQKIQQKIYNSTIHNCDVPVYSHYLSGLLLSYLAVHCDSVVAVFGDSRFLVSPCQAFVGVSIILSRPLVSKMFNCHRSIETFTKHFLFILHPYTAFCEY